MSEEIRPTSAEGPGEPRWVSEIRPAPDPWDAFERLAALPMPVFLDGAEGGLPGPRFSYISASPFEVVLAKTGRVRVSAPATEELGEQRLDTIAWVEDDPLETLRRRLAPWKTRPVSGLPPFQGGAAGVLGYGLSRWLEALPAPRRDEFLAPDLALGLYDWVLAFDHSRGTCHLVSHGFPEPALDRRAVRAEQRAREVLAILGAPTGAPPRLEVDEAERMPGVDLGPAWPLPEAPGLRSDFSRDGYLRAVEQVVERIRAGDVFQVNLSQRLIAPARSPAVELYRRLRRSNAAPFSGFLALPSHAIASSSPEDFLSLDRGKVITRPIKGTRPRGADAATDEAERRALRESSKDLAENVMIVDLLRNDLSRVAKLRSVRVPRLFEVETCPTVHHLVSEVEGELRDGLGPADLLRATFPGGSITGAPKIRAMEIIAELEPHARGFYSGSLGWIGFDGSLRLNILIRTLTIARGWVQLPVGGGVTAPSDPGAEYDETMDKAAGMLRAL